MRTTLAVGRNRCICAEPALNLKQGFARRLLIIALQKCFDTLVNMAPFFPRLPWVDFQFQTNILLLFSLAGLGGDNLLVTLAFRAAAVV